MTGPAAAGAETVGAAPRRSSWRSATCTPASAAGVSVIKIVRGVSFRVGRSASVGLVGESGSGKSLTALSVMGLIEKPGFIADGQILLNGRDLVGMPAAELSQIQGRELAMVFQEPTAALNPLYHVGAQVAEAIRAHQDVSRAAALERARELFELVGIANAGHVLRQYPHQLSGGMCQRVTIATALANEPGLLILDEPTTALDTTIQAQILDVVGELRTRLETAIVFVSHDISVVAEMCDELVVMYGGQVMESGRMDLVIGSPQHPYTQGLIGSALSVSGGHRAGWRASRARSPTRRPCRRAARSPPGAPTPCRSARRRRRSPRCPTDGRSHAGSTEHGRTAARTAGGAGEVAMTSAPLLEAQNVEIAFHTRGRRGGRRHVVRAVDDVSLAVAPGEILGLVGESGSGKTTLGQALVGLQRPDRGQVRFGGTDVHGLRGDASKKLRRQMQVVFQESRGSLNGRMRVEDIIGEGLQIQGMGDRRARRRRVKEVAQQVGLGSVDLSRYPHQFSGGQRQRIGIARALAVEPKFLVADEPVAALDVSVQAQVLNLLLDLRDELGLTYVLISHDLAVVERVSDRIAVMYMGRIMEHGPVARRLRPPPGPLYLRAAVGAADGARPGALQPGHPARRHRDAGHGPAGLPVRAAVLDGRRRVPRDGAGAAGDPAGSLRGVSLRRARSTAAIRPPGRGPPGNWPSRTRELMTMMRSTA